MTSRRGQARRSCRLFFFGVLFLTSLACRQAHYPMFCGDDPVGVSVSARSVPTDGSYLTTVRIRVTCGDDITVPVRAAPAVAVQIRYLVDGSSDTVMSTEDGSATVQRTFQRDPTGSHIEVILRSGTGTLTTGTTFTAR